MHWLRWRLYSHRGTANKVPSTIVSAFELMDKTNSEGMVIQVFDFKHFLKCFRCRDINAKGVQIREKALSLNGAVNKRLFTMYKSERPIHHNVRPEGQTKCACGSTNA